MKHKINTLKIKELLEKQSKSQAQLAKFLGIPASTITMALKGDRNISTDYVFSIAKFFNVNPFSLTVTNNTKIKKSEQENRGAKI